MKTSLLFRIYLCCCLCFTITVTKAQYIAIPDTNFGIWLNSNGYAPALAGNSTIGWQLDYTHSLVVNTTTINCSYSNIYDLDGLQYFSNLHMLTCTDNYLTSIPYLLPFVTEINCHHNLITALPVPLPDSLRVLYCSNNPITTLPALPEGMTELGAFQCSLNSLPVLPSTLLYLEVAYNDLTALPALPTGLTVLNCSGNRLISLPALPPDLGSLQCSDNLLTSLPVLPTGLSQLICGVNQLTSLPTLPPTLWELFCGNNILTSLPALPAQLNRLSADHNQLASLPTLPAVMEELNCSNNPLHTLPTLPAAMRLLNCASDQLTALPSFPAPFDGIDCHNNPGLSCLPPIARSYRVITLLNVDSTNITCLPGSITASNHGQIDPATMPLCGPGSGCDFFYNISGTAHYDSSASCLLDSLSPGAPITNMKVRLWQGGNIVQQFYTGPSGRYSFKAPANGSYTVDLDTASLPLTVVCPQSGRRTVSITALDSVKKYEGFGLQCAATDFGVSHILASRLRPTFSTTVHVDAGNIILLMHNANCGGGTAGIVTTTFTNAVHYASPAPGALTPTSVSGSTLTYTIADLNTLTAGSLDFILSVDAAAAPRSQVCITTTIASATPDAVPANNSLTECFTVLNSWDPNYKEVSPLTLSPGGGWLTYTIHFQNTGNDTAYLVVLRDTLSSHLDASSFQYLASSHPAVVQVIGSAMAFTFPKINLVDSATNPPLSEGWIQYRVQANALPLGTQVQNTAHIYFDSNPAVITNTTTNTVSAAVACTDTIITTSGDICSGDTFTFYSQRLTAPGVYEDTLLSGGGCDSIIHLTLTVHPRYAAQATYDTICSGSSLSYHGQTLSAAGTYTATLQTQYGCDSVVSIALAVRGLPVVTLIWASMVQLGYLGAYGPASSDIDTFWCLLHPYISPISGGSPAGGHYSGRYVQNDTFNFIAASTSSGRDTTTYIYVDSHGCQATAQNDINMSVVCEVGINEVPAAGILSVYPNPNVGSFTLQTTHAIEKEYTITDVLGQLVEAGTIISDKQSIDMGYAASGVYTLSLKGTQPLRFTVVK